MNELMGTFLDDLLRRIRIREPKMDWLRFGMRMLLRLRRVARRNAALPSRSNVIAPFRLGIQRLPTNEAVIVGRVSDPPVPGTSGSQDISEFNWISTPPSAVTYRREFESILPSRFFVRILFTAVAAMILCTGCGTTRMVEHKPKWLVESQRPVNPLPVPNQYGPFKSYQKLNPIWWWGNADDPEPPDWYRPGESGRRWKWYARNPLHNFTFYVIGIGDKEFTRRGTYPGMVFNPDGGWNSTWSHAEFLPLPFWSYRRGEFQFYFGWRERGNFGIKFKGLRSKVRESDEPKPNPSSDESKTNQVVDPRFDFGRVDRHEFK